MPSPAPDARNGRSAPLTVGDVSLLIGRLCLFVDFAYFGSRKFMNPGVVSGMLEAVHVPGFLVYPTILLQVGGGLLILLGFQTRLAALGLAWFCLVAPSIFWIHAPMNLTRDYAAAGGFLLLFLFGPGRFSLDHVLDPDIEVMRMFRRLKVPALIRPIELFARLLVALPLLARVAVQAHGLFSAGSAGDGTKLAEAATAIVELACAFAILQGSRARAAAALAAVAWLFDTMLLARPALDLVALSSLTSPIGDAWVSFSKDVTTIGALLIVAAVGGGRATAAESSGSPS